MREFLQVAETLDMQPIDIDHFISEYYDETLSVDDNIKNLIIFNTI